MRPRLRAVLPLPGRCRGARRRRPPRGRLQRRERGVRRHALRRVRAGVVAARHRRRSADPLRVRQRRRRRDHAVRPLPSAARGSTAAPSCCIETPEGVRTMAEVLPAGVRPRRPEGQCDVATHDAVEVISAKRDGGELTDSQIDWVIDAYTRGDVADEQMSALAMAILLNGMDAARDRALDRRHDRLGRADGLLVAVAPDRRQALHRRRRRQDHPAAGPAGRRVRRRRTPALRVAASATPAARSTSSSRSPAGGPRSPTRRCSPSSSTSARSSARPATGSRPPTRSSTPCATSPAPSRRSR